MNEFTAVIKNHAEVMFRNAEIMLKTCDLDYILCDFPIWKHVYHMLRSWDQWFINPNSSTEPDFHESDMNSLNIMTEKVLSYELLSQYLGAIHRKTVAYLDSLTDDMLYEFPQGCSYNRLSLILSQQRHFYAHLGNINGTTIVKTNKWPRVIGITGKIGDASEGLYE